jgi:C-terminal processing protease CtpA/Prc
MTLRPLRWLLLLALAAVVPPAAAAEEVRAAKLAGTVTDEAGRPIAGAWVVVNRTQEAPLEGGLPQGKADERGRFELTVRFRKADRVVVREVWVGAKAYVRADVNRAIALKDGESATIDVALARGEPLAGVIRIPLTALERRAGIKAEEQRILFEVAGGKFRQLHLSEKGGRFELYVPAGEYAVRCLASEGAPAWEGLKAGRTDLALEPKPFAWTEESAGKAFDDLWAAMDRSYSYFALKKDVDWPALKEKYRSRAAKAKSARELADVLREMLAQLKDLHVWIDTPEGTVGTFASAATPNWNRKATLDLLEQTTECGKFAVVGRTKGDGLGYFLMVRQSAADDEGVKQALAAIEKLRDAPGFVVDLRAANGGDERKARQIARLFCGKKTVYAKSKYRDGPGHGDFTREFDRWLEPAERPYLGPVVCLIGPGAVSSGEGFVKMMRALPHVTTVGLPTRGASGNPQPVELAGGGVAVWFSRWVDLLPDGTPTEGVGIAPEVEVREPAAAYAERDPTLEKGLEVLRAKVSKAKPGR